MVAVDDPDPPQEAKIETESMGVLRAHTVVVHRLANELFHIEELHLRVQQGCELDAAQREKLGREDELLTALEAAIAVAEAAFAVPQTGPGSPEKREVQSALDAQRPQQIEPKSPQQPRVEKTHKTRPRSQCKHKESVPLVQRPQIGPNSQHKEQSAHVQQPQQGTKCRSLGQIWAACSPVATQSKAHPKVRARFVSRLAHRRSR